MKIWSLRIVLTLLCALTFVWIFSNSLQSGESSSQQSHTVTDAVQDVAGVIAPDSFVATATGNDYLKLHTDVRTLAHFGEFALLGALLLWCYFSYTRQKAFLVVPLGMVFLTPLFDEWLQLSTAGRAVEISDVLVDTLGGLAGVLFASLALCVLLLIDRRRGKKSVN